jgi:RNA polymerase sigma factor (sigma-70 family)
MKNGSSRTYVRDFDVLYQVGAVGGLTDRELLDLFASGDGAMTQRSFEALVHRHGPMVAEVCRRVVWDEHTAEDVFQATFLLLALKAHAIRKRDSLGAWLHGVAVRIARRARHASGRARTQPMPPGYRDLQAPEGSDPATRELRAVLDEEADRLPEVYRRAVVLCYLEGKTQEDAARELGWSKGTVSGRLARAKDLLRARLTRRGFAPSVGLVARMLSEGVAPPTPPAALVDGAVRFAVGVVLGRGEILAASNTAMALARGTLRTMLVGKVALTAMVLVMLVAFAAAMAQTGGGSAVPGSHRPEGARGLPSSQPVRSAVPASGLLPQHAIARLGTTRLRHQSFVGGVAFAPDGRTLASTSWDGTVRFWDAATGEPSAKFPTLREPDEALSLAYSPDGTKLAIGHNAGWVRLWDLAAGRELLRAKVHHGDVQSVAFAPDGRTFATSAYEDPIVRIWDADTGRERRTLAFREAPTYRGPLAFSPDGKRLALGGTSREYDGERVSIWDLERDGDPLIIRKVHDGRLTSLAFTTEGNLISCGVAYRRVRGPKEREAHLESRPQIRIWDAASGRKIRELEPGVDRGHCKAVLSRDGKALISMHDDQILVWDLASGTITRKIDIPADERSFGVSCGIAISPDGTMAAADRHDYVVHVWDLATGKPLFTDDAAHDTTIAATISSDGRFAATGDDRGNIRIWDPARGTLLHRLELGGSGRIWSLRFASDGRSLAAAGESYDRQGGRFTGIVGIWDIPGFAVRNHLPQEHRAVCVEFSPDGRRLAIASWNADEKDLPAAKAGPGRVDNAIDVFDAATGRRLVRLPGHKGQIHVVAFASDSRTLVSAAQDNMFRFWDLASGRQTREFPIDEDHGGDPQPKPDTSIAVVGAAISADLKSVVTGRFRGDQLFIRDMTAGRVQRTFQVGPYVEGALAISPDGRLLAAAMTPLGGVERVTPIVIWDIATKRELTRLEPGVMFVRSLAFSADGKRLISGMSDTTALVWDIAVADDRPGRPQD